MKHFSQFSSLALPILVLGAFIYALSLQAQPAGATFTGNSTADDLPILPAISIGATSVVEGNTGQVEATFVITLSKSTSQVVTVDFMTADMTGVAYEDYHPISGTLTFIPGQTSQMISVQVYGDTAHESDETFALILSNPVQVTLLIAQGTGTIVNDDSDLRRIYLPAILKP